MLTHRVRKKVKNGINIIWWLTIKHTTGGRFRSEHHEKSKLWCGQLWTGLSIAKISLVLTFERVPVKFGPTQPGSHPLWTTPIKKCSSEKFTQTSLKNYRNNPKTAILIWNRQQQGLNIDNKKLKLYLITEFHQNILEISCIIIT